MVYLEVLSTLNNLEPLIALEVAVFGFAIAQVLMIVLTVRRERDVRDLRALVEEQRLRLAEMRAWVAGRNASQPRQIAFEGKSDIEPTDNVNASESEMPSREIRSSKGDAARAEKALEWQHEVADRLKSAVKVQQKTTAAPDGFKWFKDDSDEPWKTKTRTPGI